MEGISRRQVLSGVVSAAAVGALSRHALTGHPAAAATRRPYLPYSRDSYFRSRVNGARISAAKTADFRAFVKRHPDQVGRHYPNVNGTTVSNQWGTAFAKGRAGHPIWKLVGNVPDDVAVLRTRGFHAPYWFGRMLSGTSDSPFVCLDRGHDITVWGAQARVVAPYTIYVGAAGYFRHATNGLDKRNPRSNSRRNFRSRGCIPDAMVIRRDLMRFAIANGTGLGHVLHMFFVETRSAAGFRHPMVGAESGKYGWGAQGTRLALDPDIDLSRRDLSPAGLVIARTLQRHGCYLGDNAGSGSALKAQQVSRFDDPWDGIDISQHCLAGISWNDFVVLA